VVPAGLRVHMSVYDNDFTPPDLPNKLKAAGVTALRYSRRVVRRPLPLEDNLWDGGAKVYIHPNDTFDHFMTEDVLPSWRAGHPYGELRLQRGWNGRGRSGRGRRLGALRQPGQGLEHSLLEIGNEIGGNGFFWNGVGRRSYAPLGGVRKGNPALSQAAYGRMRSNSFAR